MNNYESYWDGLLRRDKEMLGKLKLDAKSMEPDPPMDEHSRNLTYCQEALDIANEHGLAAEVMWSALTIAVEANEHGLTMEQVLAGALSEWDI